MFLAHLYSLKSVWSDQISSLNGSNSDSEWPIVLDRTRLILEKIRNLVFKAETSAEVNDWIVFVSLVIANLSESFSVRPEKWVKQRKDQNGATYDYAFELARDLVRMVEFLEDISLIQNNGMFAKQISTLYGKYYGLAGRDSTLLDLLRVECVISEQSWSDVSDALIALSNSCREIGRHDRISVVSARVFWISALGRRYMAAWLALKLSFLHNKPQTILSVGVNRLGRWMETARLRQMVSIDHKKEGERLYGQIVELVGLITSKR